MCSSDLGIGLVHADLKPENLMLTSKNKDEATIKLVDFGCAGEYCAPLDICLLMWLVVVHLQLTHSHFVSFQLIRFN